MGLEEVISELARFVFEEGKTATVSTVTQLHPTWSTDTSKRVLYAFSERYKDKLSVRYIAIGTPKDQYSMSDDHPINSQISVCMRVFDSLDGIEDQFSEVESVAVFSVRQSGSEEPESEILDRNAQFIKSAVNALPEGTLWRPQYAGALSKDCPVRTIRAAHVKPPALSAPTRPTASTPSVTAKPATQPSAAKAAAQTPKVSSMFKAVVTSAVSAGPAKTATVKAVSPVKQSAPLVKSPVADSARKPESNKRHLDEDEGSVSFPKNTKKAKITSSAVGEEKDEDEEEAPNKPVFKGSKKRSIDDDDCEFEDPSAKSHISLASSENCNSSNASEPPVFETKEIEYKQKKKVVETVQSLSSDGYMEVEDVVQMKEQIVKETVTRQINKPATFMQKPKSAAPAGQRSITDMFRKH